MLPRLPYVVLDMNACRDEGIVDALLRGFAANGTEILFPAVAQWELSKGSDTTLPRSLRLLARAPEAICVSRHTYALKSIEKKRPAPLRRRWIVDHPQTSNLRSVLRGLRDDTHEIDPKTIAIVRDHWRELLAREQDASILRRLVRVHEEQCPQVTANKIRAALNQDAPDYTPFNAHLFEAIGGRVPLAKFLRRVGYGSSRSKRLTRFPSFSVLHLIGLLAVSLRWRAFGGASNAKDDKLEAAMLDVEYATLAAYGRGYETKEKGDAVAAYQGILHVAGRLWPRRL